MSDIKTFQCPNCQQFINDSMSVCKFCSAPFDAQMISTAVANQEKVNNAYNAVRTLQRAGNLIAV